MKHQQYKLHEIDEMDIGFFFELMNEVSEKKKGFINHVL